MRRDEIVDDIARVLHDTGLKPHDVILEITENVFVQNDAVWRLYLFAKPLKQQGVGALLQREGSRNDDDLEPTSGV